MRDLRSFATMAFQSGDDEAKQAAATSWKGLAASFLGVGSARLRPDREATQALQDQDLRMVVRNHTGVTKPYKFTGLGPWTSPNPIRLLGFGSVDVTKPSLFIRAWDHGCLLCLRGRWCGQMGDLELRTFDGVLFSEARPNTQADRPAEKTN